MISFYRRIFNGVFEDAPGVFASGAAGHPAPPIRKQIVDAGPDLAFDGPEVFLGGQVARCLTPKAPARRVTAERMNRLMGGIDRKSTRLNPVTNAHLVCRLLLEKKKKNYIDQSLKLITMNKP